VIESLPSAATLSFEVSKPAMNSRIDGKLPLSSSSNLVGMVG
jgi:hypothetical protein